MTVLAPRNGWRLSRALIAGAALYALVLQALLGMGTTLPSAAPSVGLCLPSGSAGVDAPAEPSGHESAIPVCCLGAVCAGGLVMRPMEAISAAWPARRPSRFAWPDAGQPAGRAMVRTAARARAPPVT